MVSEQDRRVRERAYELWVESGRPDGTAERHWLQAEREVGERAAGPASSGKGGKQARLEAGANAVSKPRLSAKAAAAERASGGSAKPASKSGKSKGAPNAGAT